MIRSSAERATDNMTNSDAQLCDDDVFDTILLLKATSYHQHKLYHGSCHCAGIFCRHFWHGV